MINRHRGEVGLTVDGQDRAMRLTLGALAALEDHLGEVSLLDLVKRFEQGTFRTSDLLALLWAGLNGGGHGMSYQELSTSEIEGGPLEAARAGARLLAVTFTEAPE